MSEYSSLDRGVVAYARNVIRFRWLVLIGVMMAVVAITSGAQHLTFSTDYRVYFGPDNPQLVAFEQVQNIYTKNDNSLIILEPSDSDNAFNADTLAAALEITERAWSLPFSLRVDSITNFQHTEAEADDLIVEDLISSPREMSPEQLTRVREIAINEPLLVGRLVSESGHAVAINVVHQLPMLSIEENPEVVAAVRELRDDVLSRYDNLNIYVTGSNFMNASFSEASQQDIASLIPIMYLVIIVITWLLLRSMTGTLTTVAVILTSMATSMGLAGFVGIQLTPPSVSAPIIVTTLAVADSIHILVSMFAGMRQGLSKNEALIDSLRLNFMPILLTSVTTALGFLSINFADSPPLRDLGNITAMGVMMAWILSVTLLPALMSMLPVKVPKQSGGLTGVMAKISNLVVSKHKPVLWISIAITVLLCSLVPLNKANETFVHYFDESIQFRQDTDWAADNITGLYTMEFNLKASGPGGVSDPEYLRKLDNFKQWWLADSRVKHVASVSDIFTRLNKNMHGDDPAWYKLPENKALAAQYLLLYEFSLPFGLDLGNQISIDKSSSRFFVAFSHLEAGETRDTVEAARQWLADNAPEMETIGVSPAVMFAFIAKRNIESMFIGMPVALVGISLLLIFALGSLRFGLLSLVPNLVPLGLAFGVWGIIDGKINFTMAIVLGMTIGIVVDDTIHFLSKYLRARRELGMNPEQAIHHSFKTVGTALTVTSLILVAGFAVLSLSAFLPNAGMAQLTSIAIVSALLADFFLLPALLLVIDRDDTAPNTDSLENTHDAATA